MNHKLIAILTEALGEYIEMLKSRANLMSNEAHESDSKIKELEEKLNELGIENASLKSNVNFLKSKEQKPKLSKTEAKIIETMEFILAQRPQNPWATANCIEEVMLSLRIHIKESTFKTLLSRLVGNGYIISKQDPNTKKHLHLYKLKD